MGHKGIHGTNVSGSGDSEDKRYAAGENEQTLTTRQGHPIRDNQNSRTVGNRGPATLENYQLIEKLSHDDGSLEIEMGAEMTPTYGKLPKEGGSPLGSNKAADAVEEANEKGNDAHPY